MCKLPLNEFMLIFYKTFIYTIIIMDELELILLDGDTAHKGEEAVIRLIGKTTDGKKIVLYDKNYRYYFYVLAYDDRFIEDLKKEIEKLELKTSKELVKPLKTEIVKIKNGLEEVRVVKVYLYKPSHYLQIKEHIKSLPYYGEKREKDIPYLKMYLSDKGVSGGKWVRVKTTREKNFFSDIDVKEVYAIHSIEEIKDRDVSASDLKIMAFDIEVIQNNGDNRIIMISYVTNEGLERVITSKENNHEGAHSVSSENEIIKEFVKAVNSYEPDIVFSYNGDGFDMEIIAQKAKKYGIDLNLGVINKKVEARKRGRTRSYHFYGRNHFDLYQFVSRILAYTLNVEVLSLDAVALELIGEGKKEMTWQEMERSWHENKDIEKIAEYCLQDSRITLKLGLFLLNNIISLADITKSFYEEISRATYGYLVESYAIRMAKKYGFLVPNKPTAQSISERFSLGEYEGAFVYEPVPGLHENIVVFDFRSLYPSIIITHNISPCTLTLHCLQSHHHVPGYNYCFLDKPQGFVPFAVNRIFNKRVYTKELKKKAKKGSEEYKKLKAQDYALKTVLNSFYGYLGFPGSRWYKRECAQAVTAYGRHYIKKIISLAKKNGFEVIYGDTDSVFLKLGTKTLEDALNFKEDVNKALPGVIKLDFQGYYIRGIFVSKKEGKGGAKKRYALIDKDGNLVIRGFERVRRDWCGLAKQTQETVLRYVLEGKIEKAKEYVKDVVNKLKNRDVNFDELIIYTTLQKNIESYEQLAPHVAVAKKLRSKGLRIFSGMTIPYIITDKKGSISEKAEFAAYAKTYDSDYYINNQVLPAALRVLSALGITKDELLGKGKQQRLFG